MFYKRHLTKSNMNEDYRNVYGWIRVKIWWMAFGTLKLSNVVSLMSVCGRLCVSISVRCPFGHVYSFKCNSQVFPVVTVVSLFSVCTFLYLICESSSGGFFCCVKCVGGCMLRFPHMWKPCLNTPCKVCLRVCLSACQSFSAYCHQVRPPACLWKTSQVRKRLGSCMLAVGTTIHAKSQHAAETMNKYLWTLHPKKVVWKNVHKRKCCFFFGGGWNVWNGH